VGSGDAVAELGRTPALFAAHVTSPGGNDRRRDRLMNRNEFERIMIEALTAARDSRG